MKNPTSPAVVSLRKEQAADRRKTPKDDLENAIEDTFPASDPLSITQTAVPSGRANVEDAEQLEDSSDSDETDSLTRDYSEARQELRDLSRDVAQLTDAVRSIGNKSVRLAKAEVRDQVEVLEDKVRAQPLLWMSLAATAGFFWGSVRNR